MAWYKVYYFKMVDGVKCPRTVCSTISMNEAYKKARQAANELKTEVTIRREKGMNLSFDTVKPGS